MKIKQTISNFSKPSKESSSLETFSAKSNILKENLQEVQSAALEAAANAIVITDIKGKIEWVNKAFTNLTGYSKLEAIGKNPRVLKSGKHKTSFYKNLWDTILMGEIWSGSIINKRKNGTFYHEEMTITPIKDSNGKIINFIAIKQDISDSQYRLNQFIKNSTLGIMRLNPEGEIIMVNPALVSTLGYLSEKEIISSNRHNIFSSPDNKNKFLTKLKKRNKVYGHEDTLRKKDGTIINVKQSAWTIKDENDNTMYYEVIVEDITELNKLLEILYESEYKYRTLIDNLNEAVYLIIDRKFEIVNQKFLELLEITEEDISKSNFNMYSFISEESKKTLLNRRKKIKQHNNIPQKYEIIIVTKSGIEKEVEISETLVNFKGKTTTQGIVRDLTKIKKAETQIRHLQKMEVIGTLAAGIAHEINTPAQFVNDNLSFLEEVHSKFKPVYNFLIKIKQGNASIKELEDIAEKIDIEYFKEEIPIAITQSIEGIQRISKIVSAMRDFSHTGPKEKTAADLHKLINNSITISRNTWKYIAEIQKDFDFSIPPIICLASELGQVFVNIIVNSAHALEEKFKDCNTIKGKINIITKNQKGKVQIIFVDNGIGMSPRVKQRIFDPFFTTKEVGKGTGQGLSIAYDIIVDKHNGTIDVETEENIGTKFIITLPVDNTDIK